MVPQSWIINCLQMYKISDEVIKFIEKTIKTRRVELTGGGRSLAETNIQRGIFQGDALSPLLVIIAMMPLDYVLRKCTTGSKLSRWQEKINHLMYMDDIKLFAKNENDLETSIDAVRIYTQDTGMDIWYLLAMKSDKRRNGTMKLRTRLERSEKRKPTNTWASWRLTIIKQVEIKKKNSKRISQEN